MAVQTQIQVRRGTASSWTSTNPTLAAGEWGLETDTGKYKVGDGSSVWTGLGYASILPSTVTTKGDLLAATGSGAVSRLAAGANGYTLVADSSTSTGLAYSPTFFAGKNKIINGDFGIWQRGTSISIPVNATTYSADRSAHYRDGSGGTVTVTQQAFTAGSAPVAGYEAQYFLQYAKSVAGTGGTVDYFYHQRIEDVRTFAGQTVTVSFWAKADAARNINVYAQQSFGSGGSSVVTTTSSAISLTTGWVRYSTTLSIPSVSGKTIGTGSFLEVGAYYTNTNLTCTFGIWGVQVEAGSTATQFQTATGTIQGELAAAQRYYYRATILATPARFGIGMVQTTTTVDGEIRFPVTMRTNPTALEQSGTAGDYSILTSGSTITVCSAVPALGTATQIESVCSFTVASGLTAGQAALIRAVNTNAYLGWSAEL